MFVIELQQSRALKTFCIFHVRYMTGRRKRSWCVCLTRNFGHQVKETQLLIMKFRFVPKSRRKSVLCSGKFRSKGVKLSLKLSRQLSWKVHVNKERNSCISLALHLHNTVYASESSCFTKLHTLFQSQPYDTKDIIFWPSHAK